MTKLFFLLEGPDDERFFESVLKEKFLRKYSDITLYDYAGRSKKQLESFMKTLKSANKEYIILSDFDNATCVTDKKSKLSASNPYFEESNIVISKSEIESWYLAGLDYDASQSLPVTYHANTETVSKEDFNKYIPERFSSKIDFMIEILKKFNFNVAMKQNSSFEYFSKKYLRHCIRS